MSVAPTNIRVIIPLTIRKRNVRPRILPPSDPAASNDAAVKAHVLRAVSRAWSWRRRLESGQASTNLDLARTEDLSELHWPDDQAGLSGSGCSGKTPAAAMPAGGVDQGPDVRGRPAVADLPWAEQAAAAFGSLEVM